MKMKIVIIFFLATAINFAAICSGQLLKNVATDFCVIDTDTKSETVNYILDKCPRSGTKFKLLEGRDKTTKRFASVWDQPRGKKAKQKCAFANTDDSDSNSDDVWSADCAGRQGCPYLQWNLKNVGDRKFFITHPKSGRCLQPESNEERAALKVVENCDENDETMLWRMENY